MADPDDWDFESRAHVDTRTGGIVFDFGKNAGRELGNIDTGYLRWLLDQDFPEDLLTAVAEELETR